MQSINESVFYVFQLWKDLCFGRRLCLLFGGYLSLSVPSKWVHIMHLCGILCSDCIYIFVFVPFKQSNICFYDRQEKSNKRTHTHAHLYYFVFKHAYSLYYISKVFEIYINISLVYIKKNEKRDWQTHILLPLCIQI